MKDKYLVLPFFVSLPNARRQMELFFFVCCALLTSNLSLAQWSQTNLPYTTGYVYALCVSDSGLFAGTKGGGVFRSTNNGTSWTSIDSGLTTKDVRALATLGTTLFSGTYGGGIFRSTDNGANWNTVNTGVTNSYVLAFAVNDTNIFAGTESGIFRSTNNGSTWSLASGGIPSTIVRALAISGTDLFAGTNGNGVYKSSNNGASWSAVNSGVTNTYIHALGVNGANLFAGSEGGRVYRSTNNGSSWKATDLIAITIQAFAAADTAIFTGAFGGGSFRSTNNDTTWVDVDLGFPTSGISIFSLAVSGTEIFAGTLDNGLWKRPLSEITSVKPLPGLHPETYSLHQNYPNPFNPRTTIGFHLPTQSHVTLKVFDMLGREVAILVNGVQEPGYRSVTFDASSLSSGAYFYRIQAGRHVETKNLLLLR